MRAEIESGDIAHAKCGIGLRSPASGLVEVGYLKLVDPHGGVFGGGGIVAHAYQYHADIAQRRVAHHGHAVAFVVGIAACEECAVAHAALFVALGAVAFFLELYEALQVEVEVVRLRPYYILVAGEVAVVCALGCKLKGHFIFIEVVFNVGTKADKHRHLPRLEVGDIVDERLGVHPHLHALVVAQIELGVAVYTAGVAGIEAGDFERHRLLVELCDLALAGVCDTRHTGR